MKNPIIILILLISSLGMAVDIQLQRNGSHYDLQVSNVPFPLEKFKSDLNSGLSTTLITSLTLFKDNALQTNTHLKFKIYYDLWDEVYYFKSLDGDKVISTIKFGKGSLNNNLSQYTFSTTFTDDEAKRLSSYTAIFELVVDPINKEKRDKIKKWLAQNQVPATTSREFSTSNDKLKLDTTTSGTIKRNLFNQILDSELNSELDTGAWNFVTPKMPLLLKVSKNEK